VTASEADTIKHTKLHGHRVAYRLQGSGPLIVLVHGITSSSATWERVMPALAERYTVMAPDLLGHGQSAKPRGDYSLGAYASGLRDLLIALGHERATFVGHSLGGGVAMQLSYQFPELCERLALVDSGGLGREVSLLLRSATLPGSEFVLPLLAQPQLLNAGRSVGRLLNGLGIGVRTDIDQLARGHASLADREAREAFVHTLRSIVDPGGQRVSATDRLYLAENMPFLIIWGGRDKIIPVAHGRAAHRQVPGSRFEEFPDSGHFPQLDEPERFVETVTGFIESTEPSAYTPERLRELLQRR
jgi:pimeloyl-ACP methyl ester carboxylesterase